MARKKTTTTTIIITIVAVTGLFLVVGILVWAFLIRSKEDITGLSTSRPFIIQFNSSGNYVAKPKHANKKLSITDNQDDALVLKASRNSSGGAALFHAFTENNAKGLIVQRDSSGDNTKKVWYLHVEGDAEAQSGVEVYSYTLGSSDKPWSVNTSWILTDDNYLQYTSTEGPSNVFLSSTQDGVEVDTKENANAITLVPAFSTQTQDDVFSSAMPFRIKFSGGSYLSGANSTSTNASDAVLFKAFQTSNGTSMMYRVPEANANTGIILDGNEVYYLDTSNTSLQFSRLSTLDHTSFVSWTYTNGYLKTGDNYLSNDNGSISIVSSQNQATKVSLEKISF